MVLRRLPPLGGWATPLFLWAVSLAFCWGEPWFASWGASIRAAIAVGFRASMVEKAPASASVRIAGLFDLEETSPRLLEALTHPSYAHENRGAPNNQRLEFLGDAVLDFCASELLFERLGQADEGALTRTRSQVVSGEALAAFAREHDLAAALRLGRGAIAGELGDSTNVLADAVEALIAACYLDRGLDAARRVCARVVEFGLDRVEKAGTRDPKSDLQERAQALGFKPPTYHVVESGGPSHEPWFEVEVSVGGRPVARGRGRSKRVAEQMAARSAVTDALFQAREMSENPKPAAMDADEDTH